MASLRVFASLSSVHEIVLVCSPPHRSFVERWCRRSKIKKSICVVAGGAIRGESVRQGLLALSPLIDVVLIHDAARAMVTADIVRRVESAAKKKGVALAAWPLADTLKLAGAPLQVKKTIPRKNLWLAQTPQGFQRKIALKCLLTPSVTATDDVELAQRRGFKVSIVEGSATNFKVTYPEDLKLCRWLHR